MTRIAPPGRAPCGSAVPYTLSSENPPGPAIPTEAATARLTSAYSNPPWVTQNFGQWILIAVSIDAAIPSAPSGLHSPRAKSAPPPPSATQPTTDQNPAGRNPWEASNPTVLLSPKPPNQPKSF